MRRAETGWRALQWGLRHARLGAAGHARRLRMLLVLGMLLLLLHVLILRVRQQERLRGHGLLWRRRRVLGVGRLLGNGRGSVGRVVHGRRQLGRRLSIDGSAVLIMLGGLDRGWRVGLGGVIDGGVARTIHRRGCHEFGCFWPALARVVWQPERGVGQVMSSGAEKKSRVNKHGERVLDAFRRVLRGGGLCGS